MFKKKFGYKYWVRLRLPYNSKLGKTRFLLIKLPEEPVYLKIRIPMKRVEMSKSKKTRNQPWLP